MSAYGGSSKNLKDLEDLTHTISQGVLVRGHAGQLDTTKCMGVWRQAGEEAGFTARVGVKHGLLHELHTAGKMYDIRYTPTDQNLRDLTPILADISLTHPFIGNAVDRDRWGTYQRKNLSQRARSKSLKHAWAENVHGVVPFVSDTLGSMAGESAATLCLFAWCQAELEAEFLAEDWGDGARTDDGTSVLMEASKRDLR